MMLLITERTASFGRLAVRFHESGIFSFVCHFDNALFYCEEKDTGGVIIDCRYDLPRGEALCEILRDRYPDLPIAALVPENAIPNMPATRIVVDCEKETLYEELLDFCTHACGWNATRLSTYELLLDKDPLQTRYMGYPLQLSDRQHVILRCLFYRMPKPTSADDLLSLCYPDAPVRVENIRVQIARINQQAYEIDPRPLIVHIRNQGYRLRQGIV